MTTIIKYKITVIIICNKFNKNSNVIIISEL